MAKRKIYVQNDPTTLRIIPALAKEIGFNESIMLLQLDFLISISNNGHIGIWNERSRQNDWVYLSIRDLRALYFPFWSQTTINRTLHKLLDMNLIIEDNFNSIKYDTTRWMALNFQGISKLKTVKVEGYDTGSNQNGTGSNQNVTRSRQCVTTIPKTSSEIMDEEDYITKNICFNYVFLGCRFNVAKLYFY